MTQTASGAGLLDHFVKSGRQLYTLPAVSVRVLELTRHPDVDARQLKECVARDPALTAKILRVANSSLFGMSRGVNDLNQALTLLGTKRLKMLVLGFSLPPQLFAGVEAKVLSHYWRRTLIKAVASRELMEQYWNREGDEAFLAGLLQDIGLLALVQGMGAPFVKFLDHVFANGENLTQMEMATFGFDHAILSARMLDRWGLPQTLVRAVSAPHDAQQLLCPGAQQQDLPQALHLADLLSRLLEQSDLAALRQLLEIGPLYCGLRLEELESFLVDLAGKVVELADVMSLELPRDLDYGQILAQAHTQLAEASEEFASTCPSDRKDAFAMPDDVRALHEAAHQMVQRLETSPLLRGRRPDFTSESAQVRPASQAEVRGRPRRAIGSRGGIAQPDLGFLGQLIVAINACRQARDSLSLVLAEIDGYEDMIVEKSARGAARQVERFAQAIDAACSSSDVRLHLGDARYAIILQDCDRAHAVEISRHLMGQIQQRPQALTSSHSSSITLSVGVASVTVPPKNFPPQDLIEAAERCLYAARASGGNSCKSIEIY